MISTGTISIDTADTSIRRGLLPTFITEEIQNLHFPTGIAFFLYEVMGLRLK